MKDYSLSPYKLTEIGREVKRLGEKLGVKCVLNPFLSLDGEYYGLQTLSGDISRLAEKYGIQSTPSTSLAQLGNQLQSLLCALRQRGIID